MYSVTALSGYHAVTANQGENGQEVHWLVRRYAVGYDNAR